MNKTVLDKTNKWTIREQKEVKSRQLNRNNNQAWPSLYSPYIVYVLWRNTSCHIKAPISFQMCQLVILPAQYQADILASLHEHLISLWQAQEQNILLNVNKNVFTFILYSQVQSHFWHDINSMYYWRIVHNVPIVLCLCIFSPF